MEWPAGVNPIVADVFPYRSALFHYDRVSGIHLGPLHVPRVATIDDFGVDGGRRVLSIRYWEADNSMRRFDPLVIRIRLEISHLMRSG